MSEMKKDLGQAASQSVFKTEDPAEIRDGFAKAFDAWSKDRSTLGGYLRDVRFLRRLSPPECALKTGVSRAQWQSWEADRETPSLEEIEKICLGMEFCERKQADLLYLRKQASRHRLLMLSRLRPELLAARGVAKVEASMEWQKLPSPVQQALAKWGKEKGFENAEAMIEFFLTLQDEETRLAWVNEVLEGLDELV